MPYVKQERRPALDRVVDEMVKANLDNKDITDLLCILTGYMWLPNEIPYMSVIDTVKEVGARPNGDLNYVLFKYCRYHIEPSYNNYKSYIGAIRRAAQWLANNRYILRDHNDYVNGYVDEYIETAEWIRIEILANYEREKILENGDI